MTRKEVCECVKLCVEDNCKECPLDGIENCVNRLLGKVLDVLRFDTTTIKDLQKESKSDVT